jgi:hypothetical protein
MLHWYELGGEGKVDTRRLAKSAESYIDVHFDQ